MNILSNPNSYSTSLGQKSYKKRENLKSLNNICFNKAYAMTFEDMEDGKVDQFIFTSENGTVNHTFIKRLIPSEIDNQLYYDIITPYGFGGPVVIESFNKEVLLNEYFEAFHEYCLKNNIVSEFIRFHFSDNTDVMSKFNGETNLIHSVICRDLMKPLTQDIEPRLTKDVIKAENYGLTIEFDYSGHSQRDFLKIYTETMNRNQAEDFYYIKKEFLDKLQDMLEGHFLYANTRLDGEVIASRLIIFDNKYGYYFLGGNAKEFYKYKNGTFLDFKLLSELKANGLNYYVFGGGHKGQDGIYRYKKKFDTKGDIPFYVGKKIHMSKEYDYLTLLRKLKGNFNTDTLFFPLYRAPESH